jgi:hypothetical protein
MPPATEEQFNEAMMLLYNKHFETHITPEILKKIATHYPPRIYATLSDSVNYAKLFFRSDTTTSSGVTWSYYAVTSEKDNIFRIMWRDPNVYGLYRFYITLRSADLAYNGYKHEVLYNMTCKERKIIQQEFETDILPKIHECLKEVQNREDKQTSFAENT